MCRQIEKMQNISPQTCAQLKKQLVNSEKQTTYNEEENEGLNDYFSTIGISLDKQIDPNEVERLFSESERLTPEEYVKAVNLLIDEVVKSDSSKSYNLFLRSISYARRHMMYNSAKLLIKKALNVFCI